jgi:hypothetical protein
MLGTAQAEDFTAGFVMENMDRPERYTYVSGIIEGLAYARYVADGKQAGLGMRCIYEWFYDDSTHRQETIYAAFERFPDHTPGAIVAALAEQECGTP